jgi:hypothetical protein
LAKNLVFKSTYSPTLEWIIAKCLKIDTKDRIQWEYLFLWMNTGKLNLKENNAKTGSRIVPLKSPRESAPVFTSISFDEPL